MKPLDTRANSRRCCEEDEEVLDVETGTEVGNGGTGGTTSPAMNIGEVSPEEIFQGSNGSPAPTFPLRTFLGLNVAPGAKLILARVFNEGKEGRDLKAGR